MNQLTYGSAMFEGSWLYPQYRQAHTQTDHVTPSVAIGNIYPMHAMPHTRIY